jgi:phosphatidylserine/phosphatidylglycerophosphate/cardiolipin synthase-like enzyme
MTADESDNGEEWEGAADTLRLSNGAPLVGLEPAFVMDSPSRIVEVQKTLLLLARGSADDAVSSKEANPSTHELLERTNLTQLRVDKDKVNVQLQRQSAPTLSSTEFNTLFSTLCAANVAEEVPKSGRAYSEYEFELDLRRAVRVLDQEIVASKAIGEFASTTNSGTSVEVSATLPSEAPGRVRRSVDATNPSLSRLVLRAEDTLRVAAPYFDPEERVVREIASQMKSGVDVQFLTRELLADGSFIAPSEDALDALVAIECVVDDSSAIDDHFEVRDLYETNQSGLQTGAVHAKVVVADERRCYLGSANFTSLGLRGNFELGVFLEGDPVKRVTKVFDAMFDRGRPVPT